MKIFQGFNPVGKCPVCKTNTDKPCVLIPIHGTNEDGGMNYQAEAIHVDCLELWTEPFSENDERIEYLISGSYTKEKENE